MDVTEKPASENDSRWGCSTCLTQRRCVSFTYRVSGHEHRLADERSADLKVLQPVVDVIVGVERADGELSWLMISRKTGSESVQIAFSNVLCITLNIYHNVDFSFPFLDDKGASQSQAFVGVVTFQSRPQGCYQTVASCPLLCSDLYDLEKHTGEEDMLHSVCFC